MIHRIHKFKRVISTTWKDFARTEYEYAIFIRVEFLKTPINPLSPFYAHNPPFNWQPVIPSASRYIGKKAPKQEAKNYQVLAAASKSRYLRYAFWRHSLKLMTSEPMLLLLLLCTGASPNAKENGTQTHAILFFLFFFFFCFLNYSQL